MRFKQYILCFLLFSVCPIGYVAGLEATPMKTPLIAAKIGIVDLSYFFNEYLENLDSLKKARSHYQEVETSLKKLSPIFEQPESLDSLSTKEEEALCTKYQALTNDLRDSQTQIYQIMIDSQKLLQSITIQASEVVAQKMQLNCIVNKPTCWYIHLEENWAYDVTSFVIAEINEILTNQI
jgi:Skp family chaperone for outer membrane proteins